MRKKLYVFLLAMSCAVVSKSQVSGKIVDEKGAPIPFVSIVLKGKTKLGTTSDQDGKFSIAASKGHVLVVSAINYATREVAVGEGTSIEIALAPVKVDLS